MILFGPVTIMDTTVTLLLNPSVNGSLFISPASSTANLSVLTDSIGFAADMTYNVDFGDSLPRLLYYVLFP